MTAAPQPRRPLAGVAFVGAIAIALIAGIVVLNVLRPSDEQQVAARPSGTASPQISTSASPSASSAAPTPQTTGATSAVKPDAQHGLITFTNIRTEADPKDLQQPPYFARTTSNDFTVAVSPDGRRVAVMASGETGTRLVTFTTVRPNDVTVASIDFSTSGELAGEVVWAGDGSDFVVFSVDKRAGSVIAYSALRSYDIAAKKQSEIARVTTGLHLRPLAWSFATHVGGAVDVDITTGRAASYYVIRDNALADRTTLSGSFNTQITASRDGKRIVAVAPPTLRWWPTDQPGGAKEVEAQSRGRVEYAAFRPGADELGVSVVAPSVGGVPLPGHFEIWSLSGQQRVVSATAGFSRWRADGTAAIDGTSLVDPNTGAVTPLPGGAFKIVDVVLF